jgi:hypothetical protein
MKTASADVTQKHIAALGMVVPDALVSSRSTVTIAEVNAEVDTALADYDAPTKAEMDAGFAALNDLSAAEVNAEIDTALSDYDAPTKAEMDSGFAAVPAAVAAEFASVGVVPINEDGATLDDLLDDLAAAHGTGSWEGDPSLVTMLTDVLEDTSETLPAAIAAIDFDTSDLATAANLAIVDANVNAIKLITDELDATSVTQVVASSAGHLIVTAGLTFEESVSGLIIPADWTKAYWTLKSDEADTDTSAIIQLAVSNPSSLTDGLKRLNGAALVAPVTVASGTLTVDQPGGRITINLADEATILLSKAGSVKSKAGALGWDVKFLSSSTGESTGRRGTAAVVLTETKAIS